MIYVLPAVVLIAASGEVVPRYGVYEHAIDWPSAGYANPWEDVRLAVVLTSPSGKEIKIGGFYYGPDAWKLRFAPSEVGDWTWKAEIKDKAGSKTLEDIAKEFNGEVMTSDPLKRNDIGVNVLPAAVAQAFTLPQGGYGSAPSGIDEGRIVFKVETVTAPPKPDAAGLAQVKEQLGLFVSDDVIAEYFGALEKRYGVNVNQQALARLTGTGEQP